MNWPARAPRGVLALVAAPVRSNVDTSAAEDAERATADAVSVNALTSRALVAAPADSVPAWLATYVSAPAGEAAATTEPVRSLARLPAPATRAPVVISPVRRASRTAALWTALAATTEPSFA
jgi:hypothetical protein